MLGVVRECHFVFDEGVFGSLLFGLFVFGDSFVILALFVKLHALIDQILDGIWGGKERGACGEGEND